MGINKINVLKRIKLKKEKETRNDLADATAAERWGTSLQTAGNMS